MRQRLLKKAHQRSRSLSEVPTISLVGPSNIVRRLFEFYLDYHESGESAGRQHHSRVHLWKSVRHLSSRHGPALPTLQICLPKLASFDGLAAVTISSGGQRRRLDTHDGQLCASFDRKEFYHLS